MKKLILLGLAFCPFVVFSQTSQKCTFTIDCGNDFNLEFKSPSNECIEDDTTITFFKNGISHKLEMAPAFFYEISNVGNVTSSCKSTNYSSVPLFIKNDKALMFIRRNGRPGFDIIAAIYFDTKTGNVIDKMDIGRYMRSTFGLLKAQKGYKFQLQEGWLKEMQCDCDAAALEKWVEVYVQKDKIVKRWL